MLAFYLLLSYDIILIELYTTIYVNFSLRINDLSFYIYYNKPSGIII